MTGLPKEAIESMLMKGIQQNRNTEVYMSEILDHLIPNIAEVIAANNDAIGFTLKDD
ncbi:hypothetical protein ACFLW1_02140 [Chloroflexota bacterium]